MNYATYEGNGTYKFNGYRVKVVMGCESPERQLLKAMANDKSVSAQWFTETFYLLNK